MLLVGFFGTQDARCAQMMMQLKLKSAGMSVSDPALAGLRDLDDQAAALGFRM